MMRDLLYGGVAGGLEIRAVQDGAVRIAGAFPYEARAVIADGREERFARRAFGPRVDDPDADIRLLAAHDMAKPLASRRAGTLTLRDGDEALRFEAQLSPDVAETSHGRDALALIRAALAKGLSPGFRVARDADGAPAEGVTREADGTILRTIRRADLFELSIVTAPAYEAAQVEARSWAPGNRANTRLPDFLRRWRY